MSHFTLLFGGVSNYLKIVSVNPVINVVSERSCPTLRRLKTLLRTTISQEQLSNFILLTVYNERLDSLNLYCKRIQ